MPVGDGIRSGDAIAMRFERPDTAQLTHVIIDAGFQRAGEKLVEFVSTRYDTSTVDLAILTHPDEDHIGGMGIVLRELKVDALALHRLDAHGGNTLRAAGAVKNLCNVAEARGTDLYDAFQGLHAFGGALLVAGPTPEYYEQLVAAQVAEERSGRKAAAATARRSRIVESAQQLAARALNAFPVEFDFDDAGGTNPRNNSSAIVDVRLDDQRLLFTGDAGIPALKAALDFLDLRGRTDIYPTFLDVPHHGSRHNLDRSTIERLAGPASSSPRGTAFISVAEKAAEDPRYPSPRVTNALGRRGYFVGETKAQAIWHSRGVGPRPGYGPIAPVPPKDESVDDR